MIKTAPISVSLLNKSGSDLTVVNAARVSFSKHHSQFDEEKDEKLISYLARNNHWSPFSHCFLSFHIRAPIFVARQLVKHQVGLSWNEVSRRYVDSEPEFYFPKEWRGRAENVKQGSSDQIITHFGELFEYDEDEFKVCDTITGAVEYGIERLLFLYEKMIKKGVCPEQARMILPQNTMTEWYWSGSLYAFARVCNLRLDPHAQLETSKVAEQILEFLKQHFPISTKYLVNARTN